MVVWGVCCMEKTAVLEILQPTALYLIQGAYFQSTSACYAVEHRLGLCQNLQLAVIQALTAIQRQSCNGRINYGDINHHSLTFVVGGPRSLDMHKRRQGGTVATVPRDAEITNRSAAGIFPQARRFRDTTYHGRAGQCPFRISAAGRAVHGAHNQPPIQHPPGH